MFSPPMPPPLLPAYFVVFADIRHFAAACRADFSLAALFAAGIDDCTFLIRRGRFSAEPFASSHD